LLDFNGELYVRKRGAGDIWENLYEFILIEASEPLVIEDFRLIKEILGETRFEVEHISASYKQLLTHQTIKGQFIKAKINKPLAIKGYNMVGEKALRNLPFPKFISNYLKDKNVSLNMF